MQSYGRGPELARRIIRMACSAFLAFAERSDLQGNDLLRIRNSSYARASSLAAVPVPYLRAASFSAVISGSRPPASAASKLSSTLMPFGSCMKSW